MEELRQIRKSRGLSQRDLAKLAGVTQSTIALLEVGGHHKPRLETLEKLAGALGVEVADLLPKEAPQPHELTLEWLLGAHNRERHLALQTATQEDLDRLVEEIDAEFASLKERYGVALTAAEREAIMERVGRVGMMKAMATFGPAVRPVRRREKVEPTR